MISCKYLTPDSDSLPIEKNIILVDLCQAIKKHTPLLHDKHNFNQCKNQKTLQNKVASAKIISKFWRNYQLKKQYLNDPYTTHLSFFTGQDQQRLLTSIMFGRHQAELSINSPYRTSNLYIHEKALYHRVDDLTGMLLDQLISEFEIDKNPDNHIIPLINLHVINIENFIKQIQKKDIPSNWFKYLLSLLSNKPLPQIIQKPEKTVSLLILPSHYAWMKASIVNAGLTASPWEIAMNITRMPFHSTPATHINSKLSYIREQPYTIETLHESEAFSKLRKIAKNHQLPTRYLAASLCQMLKRNSLLGAEAIQRISLMINLATTFYVSHYPRFAFCVYVVIHEISLMLAQETQSLNIEFNNFWCESRTTLANSLGLSEDQLKHAKFLALPAISGTNAFMIAKRIASHMNISHTKKIPSIEVIQPTYFELTVKEFTTPYDNAPDIYMFSTGPMVDQVPSNGSFAVYPGCNINQLIRKKIIDVKRNKSVTLIIDTTTTLYKNLKLDNEIVKLIEQGRLSIILFESHQKFGLIHTDQAQYGRLFGWCSTKDFDESILEEIQKEGISDFKEHLDLRIGAYISVNCRDILEEIKIRHFRNGALFSQVLNHSNRIHNDVVEHEYMLTNLDELYFFPIYRCHFLDNIIPQRSSFGHFSTTLSFIFQQNSTVSFIINEGNSSTTLTFTNLFSRLCANASDDIDSLITAARIYLAHYYTPEKLAHILINNQEKVELILSEQIILLAIINDVSLSPLFQTENSSLYWAMKHALTQCVSLRGREAYLAAVKKTHAFQDAINSKLLFWKLPDMSSESHSLINLKVGRASL